MSPPKFLETENAISRREANEYSGNGGGGGGGGFGGSYPPPSLKINKDSHFIKKPPSPPSSSSVAAVGKPRHPVIIYTHSPKVIHTNPKDFMALVQKLTGMSRSDDDHAASSAGAGDRRGKPATNRAVSGPGGEDSKSNNNNRNHGYNNSYNRSYAGNRKGIFVNNAMFSEDSESSSVITTEENIGEQGQVNSSSCSFAAVPAIPPPPYPSPAMFDASSPAGINYGAYLSSIPIFAANPADGFLCGNQSLANFEMDPMFFAHNMRSSFSSSSSSSGFDGLTEFRDF